jgi:tRNA pseudouridine55 synthase
MNGILNINKSTGYSSFDVVRKVKKLAHTKKVGHTGTLDPEASGVLPICIGKATKFADYIMKADKVYRTHLKLGVVTDTYDKEGSIVSTSEVISDEDEIIKTIKSYIGKSKQIPPMYSALKINGQRLYSLARQGINVERKPRDIEIFSIDILEINIPDVIFDVKCSKGTYIRSLCYDIGEKLSCGGAMWGLIRLSSGFFTIENSVRLEDLTEDNISNYIIPVDDALWNYTSVNFDSKYESMLLNGVSVKDVLTSAGIVENTLYKVYINGIRFIGLGQAEKSGFKMVKQFIEE